MYFLTEYIDGGLKESRLSKFLAVRKNDAISFAGAGGKTTVITELARELEKENRGRILIATTTKMYMPCGAVTEESLEAVKRAWEKRSLITAGRNLGRKMGCFSLAFLQKIIEMSDTALIEADGAKRLPFKMPKDGEPVYLEQSNKIVYTAGMNALGMYLKDLCRSELLQRFLNKSPFERLTADDIIKVMKSRQGALKDVNGRDFFVILNQADENCSAKRAAALYIAEELAAAGFKTAVGRRAEN